MKKILFVALVATLLAAGCQKTEVINQVNPDGQPAMTFSTGISKLTKSATSTGTANLQDQGFVLSVYNAFEDELNNNLLSGIYDELNNVEWTYDPTIQEENKRWQISTKNSYFWPGKDRDLVFFALSSKQDYQIPAITITGDEAEGGIYKNVTVSGYVIQDYTVVTPTYVNTEQVGADDDLLVADVVIQNQDEQPTSGEKGRVDLKFKHTLSKVEFVFSTMKDTETAYPVVLNSIEIKDVVKTADLNVNVDLKNRISENEYVWGTHTKDDKTYVITADAEAGEKETYKVDYELSLTSNEQTYSTWLVIPQDLEGKKVSITYTISDNSNADSKSTTFVSEWPLAVSDVVEAWEINHYVKYKVTLAPHIIRFNPSVKEEWNEAVTVDPSTGQEVKDTPVTPDPEEPNPDQPTE